MARTLTLGLTLALGATLLAPATMAAADTAASCPAETLTESQLNHVLVDITTATVAKGENGFRSTSRTEFGEDFVSTTVLTRDAANGRFDENSTFPGDLGALRYRTLSDGTEYTLASTAENDDKPALAVLGRKSIWVSVGRSADPAEGMRPPTQLFFVPTGGTCTQDENGLTLTFDEYGMVTTLVTDPTLAQVSSTTTYEGLSWSTTTIAYGRFAVADIPAENRISAAGWMRALRSADQRAELTGYAKKVAAGAKAAATKAHRAVRAKDVKAVKPALPRGVTRSTLNTGISATTTDAYTRKTLRITVTVAQQTLRIGDNW